MEEIGVSKITGLSDEEVQERIRKEGYNELPSTKRHSILSIAWGVAREPMFILLIACGLIYLILGEHREAFLLLFFVFVVMGITLYQERKTERALEALRDLSSPRAMVIRNAVQKRIPGREVVRGDILILSEGDRVPADAEIIWCRNFFVDESLLTGESVPVRKAVAGGQIYEQTRPGGDDQPYSYSGTLVVQGRAIGKAYKVGTETEIGKIGKRLQTVEPEKTSLQKETGRLVQNLALFGLSLCALAVAVYGLTRGSWLNGILAGITMAMAMVPEEFPVVMTVFLALGAWRISQKNVLTRKIPAVETLGSATVLCVDKTGTLTLNSMSVKELNVNGFFWNAQSDAEKPFPEKFHELLEFSILASQRDPFDPMEKALRSLGSRYLSNTTHLHSDWTLVLEYSISPELIALSHAWSSPDNGGHYVVAVKGSPEAIFDLCHLDKKRVEDLSIQVCSMADKGFRVLGVAKAIFSHSILPGGQHDFPFEYLGLVGFADPIRPSVPSALQDCYRAGIRVVMITGDYPGTAKSIARQIGLRPLEECITGPELELMDDDKLRERIKSVNIFARVVPEQKLRLVNALKANGEVVAMTGDGVNDAPALKSANIGIAMGEKGTDVAREAAALVLLEDDFSSIVQAIRIGRRIFDNLKKAMAYIIAIHVPIAGMSLLPILFQWPLVFSPVHIALLELIIDPACSIAFEAEPEEKEIMENPPRNPNEPLFGWRTAGLSFLQGVSVLIIILGVFLIALYRGQGENEARALTFTALVVANLALILANRSWFHSIVATLKKPNPALWWVIGGTSAFLGLVLYVPFLRHLCRFSFLHPTDILISLAAGIASIVWFELLKVLRKSRNRSVSLII